MEALSGRRLPQWEAPATVQLAITPEDWQDYLGQPGSETAFYRYFLVEVGRRHGSGRCLAEHLPVLLEGVAGDAFNGLARLADGLKRGSLAMLAAGLASLAAYHRRLPGADPHGGQPFATVTETLRSAALERFQRPRACRSGDIQIDLFAAVNLPQFPRYLARTLPDDAMLPELARHAIGCYWTCPDPYIGRLVGACHDLRVVSRYINLPWSAWDGFWRGYLALTLAADPAPPAPTVPLPGTVDWTELESGCDPATRALVRVCYAESLHYGDPRYALAARNLVGG